MKYLKNVLDPVPQTEAASIHQVQNSAGGFTFQVDDWTRLDRFLTLGSEGGTYYTSERKLTIDNARCIERLIQNYGVAVVERITRFSEDGRGAKTDPAIFALAYCAFKGDDATKKAAFVALPKVCRIGTHLFHFAEFMKSFGQKWGPRYSKGIANWFNSKDVRNLATQLIKYQQRDGWSAADLIKLSHPTPKTADHSAVYRWATWGYDECASNGMVLPAILEAFEEAKGTNDVRRLIALIKQYKLPRECVPTQWLTNKDVWAALLDDMKPWAMVRNLATMTRVGLVEPLSDATKLICDRLTDSETLRSARLHPMQVLEALKTYQSGHGLKGGNTWTPVPQITSALDAAFYGTFKTIKPTGKRTLLGVDVSGSMDGGTVAGSSMTPREAAAAMALVTAATETDCHIMGFSHQFVDIGIRPDMRLDDVVFHMRRIPMGMTDCALPMLWAIKNKKQVESFAVYTDNETYFGSVHPHVALKQHRDASGIQARCAVVALTPTEFTIADPNDAGMMDFCGFDASAPSVMADFFRGSVDTVEYAEPSEA